jgi:site-specific DNA-methyltransferase (adenine-specific)
MKISKGTIYKVGNHIIGCGDSLDSVFVAKVIGSNTIRTILTDPPYGVAYVENKQGMCKLGVNDNKVIANDHIQTENEYTEFTRRYLDAAKPFLAPYNTCYIFNADPMFPALRNGMRLAGFYYGQMLLWVKNQPVMSRKDYLSVYELIAYGWFGKHKLEQSKTKNIIYHPKPTKSKLHPTQKPPGLLRKIIPDTTKVGDVIYDPFLGSGSTAVACEHLGRRCIGIELDEEYVSIILSRLEKLTKQKAIEL